MGMAQTRVGRVRYGTDTQTGSMGRFLQFAITAVQDAPTPHPKHRVSIISTAQVQKLPSRNPCSPHRFLRPAIQTNQRAIIHPRSISEERKK
jgi:hypothetical protein